MEQRPVNLSPAEWRVMECLWNGGSGTLMQMVKALKEETGWAKSTVTTMIRRMEAKGLIYSEEGEKAKRFFPAIDRAAAARSETESLLSRVYHGRVGLMVNALVERGNLSEEDIQELYAILERAEEKQS